MIKYETPSLKVVSVDVAAIICLSPSNPDADSSTEKLIEDGFEW